VIVVSGPNVVASTNCERPAEGSQTGVAELVGLSGKEAVDLLNLITILYFVFISWLYAIPRDNFC
jgi:hypothetical protein